MNTFLGSLIILLQLLVEQFAFGLELLVLLARLPVPRRSLTRSTISGVEVLNRLVVVELKQAEM